MKKQIEIVVTHKRSNAELLFDKMSVGEYATTLNTKLGREEAGELRNAIRSAALLDADDIRKEAHVAVVKLSASLETTTRLLADAQERLKEADQVIAELSRIKPEA